MICLSTNKNDPRVCELITTRKPNRLGRVSRGAFSPQASKEMLKKSMFRHGSRHPLSLRFMMLIALSLYTFIDGVSAITPGTWRLKEAAIIEPNSLVCFVSEPTNKSKPQEFIIPFICDLSEKRFEVDANLDVQNKQIHKVHSHESMARLHWYYRVSSRHCPSAQQYGGNMIFYVRMNNFELCTKGPSTRHRHGKKKKKALMPLLLDADPNAPEPPTPVDEHAQAKEYLKSIDPTLALLTKPLENKGGKENAIRRRLAAVSPLQNRILKSEAAGHAC